MRWKSVLLWAVLLAFTASVAQAAIIRVAVVETSDPAAYVKQIKQAEADLQKKGSQIKVRVWRGLFAGDKTGSVVVVAEYPSLAALAADRDRGAGEPGIRSMMARIDQVGKVVSDSIYTEITGLAQMP